MEAARFTLLNLYIYMYLFIWSYSVDMLISLSKRTCVLRVGGGVGVGHRVDLHELLLEHGQQEGDAVVQADVQDELGRSYGQLVKIITNTCGKIITIRVIYS